MITRTEFIIKFINATNSEWCKRYLPDFYIFHGNNTIQDWRPEWKLIDDIIKLTTHLYNKIYNPRYIESHGKEYSVKICTHHLIDGIIKLLNEKHIDDWHLLKFVDGAIKLAKDIIVLLNNKYTEEGTR